MLLLWQQLASPLEWQRTLIVQNVGAACSQQRGNVSVPQASQWQACQVRPGSPSTSESDDAGSSYRPAL